MAGVGVWRFGDLTFSELIAAHEAAAKEPMMPRPKAVAR